MHVCLNCHFVFNSFHGFCGFSRNEPREVECDLKICLKIRLSILGTCKVPDCAIEHGALTKSALKLAGYPKLDAPCQISHK